LVNILGQHSITLPFNAEATLTKRYAVKKGTADNGMIAPTAITDIPLGILVDSGVSGDHLAVCVFGECEGISGAAVTAGTWLTIDNTGRLVPAASTSYPLALCLEAAGTADRYMKVFVNPTGVVKA
jgi:hypothetical protein